MRLSDVSKTAIATLRCHVIESRKKDPILVDPMAGFCLDKLSSFASGQEKSGIFGKKLSATLTNHIAIRARKYDNIIDHYISGHPGCTVVNLGCGFDTRYWRINNRHCTFFDLDLPEVIEVKRQILEGRSEYEMLACSVLDPSWIGKITANGNRNILLVAEALFMYLPKTDVMALFRIFSERFLHSQIVLEVVTEKYTRGLWKKIVVHKIKRELGLDAGSSFNFGIRNAKELESYAGGIQVVNEWSYVEDPDIYPKILKYMGISRTQWTITATINNDA